jgi:quercetin dioxygenase-like cupin family protein
MAQSYWLFGSRLTILADAGDTGGHFDLIEGQFPAGAQTPLHRHNRYIEQLYVLEGEYTVWAGTQTAVLRAGDTFTIPSGTAHVVAATGNAGARGLAVAAPSAFAHLIKQVGTLDQTGVPPSLDAIDMALFERISAEIGDEVLGPPGTLPTA